MHFSFPDYQQRPERTKLSNMLYQFEQLCPLETMLPFSNYTRQLLTLTLVLWVCFVLNGANLATALIMLKFDDVYSFFADLYAEKIRYAAVRCMSHSYRPTVPVTYIAQVLGFTSVLLTTEESEDADGVEDCMEWLKAHGACLTSDNSGEMQFDAKVRLLPDLYGSNANCSTRMCG